jgi:hypothetical protein
VAHYTSSSRLSSSPRRRPLPPRIVSIIAPITSGHTLDASDQSRGSHLSRPRPVASCPQHRSNGKPRGRGRRRTQALSCSAIRRSARHREKGRSQNATWSRHRSRARCHHRLQARAEVVSVDGQPHDLRREAPSSTSFRRRDVRTGLAPCPRRGSCRREARREPSPSRRLHARRVGRICHRRPGGTDPARQAPHRESLDCAGRLHDGLYVSAVGGAHWRSDALAGNDTMTSHSRTGRGSGSPAMRSSSRAGNGKT